MSVGVLRSLFKMRLNCRYKLIHKNRIVSMRLDRIIMKIHVLLLIRWNQPRYSSLQRVDKLLISVNVRRSSRRLHCGVFEVAIHWICRVIGKHIGIAVKRRGHSPAMGAPKATPRNPLPVRSNMFHLKCMVGEEVYRDCSGMYLVERKMTKVLRKFYNEKQNGNASFLMFPYYPQVRICEGIVVQRADCPAP